MSLVDYSLTVWRSTLRGSLCARFLMIALATNAAIAAAQSASSASQKSDANREQSVEIEPYTGPPIYLPEADAPPEPKAVETSVIKRNYEETDIPRFERGVVRYSDDSVKSDGVMKEYFTNGQLFVDGEFDAGQPAGEWVYYHENGNVAKKVTYNQGRPDGMVEVFDETGKLIAKRNYSVGKRSGKWTYYDREGDKILREESYAAGKANGEWKTWYKNGQLRQVTFFEAGSLNGTAKEWTRLGEQRAIAEFKEGKRHGKTTQWQADGTVIERLYDEGQLVDQSKKPANES